MILLGLAAAFVVIAIGIPGVAAPVTATAAIAAWLQTALVIVVIRRLSLCPAQSPTEWMALLLIVARRRWRRPLHPHELQLDACRW